MIVKFIKKGIKKLARGVKKVVKGIGKGIKKVVKGIGKFMGKIGIVGQIAMAFILPGIGGFLAKSFAGVGGAIGKMVGTMAGSANPFISGAGKLLQAAGNFAKAGHSAFKTVTEGIGSFVKEFTTTALKKVPGADKIFPSLKNAPDTFFKGKDSAWSKVSENVMKNGSEIVSNFNKAIGISQPPVVSTTPPPLLSRENIITDVAPEVSIDVDASAVTTPESIMDVKGLDGKPIGDSMLGDLGKAPTVSPDTKITSLLEPQQGLGQSPVNSVLNPDNVVTEGLQSAVGEGVTATTTNNVVEDGFFTRLGKSTKDAILSVPEKIIEAPGKFVDNLGSNVESALQVKALQAVGLEDKPVYTTNQSTFVAPTVEMATPGTFASSEINDRAYQMSINPTGFSMSNPWGSPANVYQQELGARYYG